MKTGVILTDIQGDFTDLKHGSLAVKGIDQPFIDTVLAATKMLTEKGFAIFCHPRLAPHQPHLFFPHLSG